MDEKLKHLIDNAKRYYFSENLCEVIRKLYDASYSIAIEFFGPPLTSAFSGLRTSYLVITVRDKAMRNPPEEFRCVLPEVIIDSASVKGRYDSLAELISQKMFRESISTETYLNEDTSVNYFIENLHKELLSRGDFTIDIPKFVDVLFKLGVIIPIDDIDISAGANEKLDKEKHW